MTLASKLHPDRFSAISGKMAAIVGYIPQPPTRSEAGKDGAMILTVSHHRQGDDRSPTVPAMRQRSARSLALDLVKVDLGNPGTLASLVIAHTLAPARAAWSLPAPRRGEGRGFFVERSEIGPGGLRINHIGQWHLDESVAHFDPVVRGLLLFAWLFPESVPPRLSAEAILHLPGYAFLADSTELMLRPYEAIAHLVHGLLGLSTPRPLEVGGGYHRPSPNPAALADLGAMQELVTRAIGPLPDDDRTFQIKIGLEAKDTATAIQLDEILRRDVRRRIVSLTTFEDPVDDDDTGPDRTLWFKRAAFATSLPESLCGLVALDYSEQLGIGRTTGICGRCGRPFRLSDRQIGQADRGRRVYHEDCAEAQKLAYWRDYQRRRYARSKAAAEAAR